MTLQAAPHLKVKLFLGFALTAELRMLLNQSLAWKHHKIHSSSSLLKETHFKHKDYLGFYIEAKSLSLTELKHWQEELRSQFEKWIGDTSTQMEISIFTQVLVY